MIYIFEKEGGELLTLSVVLVDDHTMGQLRESSPRSGSYFIYRLVLYRLYLLISEKREKSADRSGWSLTLHSSRLTVAGTVNICDVLGWRGVEGCLRVVSTN